ncbi:DUF1284 domain-containing protein [bacterium]|nr:DUF1284 domain-containing protein [bacterium]
MQVSLRPHHFLCLKGYRGLSYNETHKTSWSLISKLLKESPGMDVLIVHGNDDLCKKCPAQVIKNRARCLETAVNELDENVKNLLGIVTGNVYKYSDIQKILQEKMTSEKHSDLCSFCAWWKKGLCRDSFKK